MQLYKKTPNLILKDELNWFAVHAQDSLVVSSSNCKCISNRRGRLQAKPAPDIPEVVSSWERAHVFQVGRARGYFATGPGWPIF